MDAIQFCLRVGGRRSVDIKNAGIYALKWEDTCFVRTRISCFQADFASLVRCCAADILPRRKSPCMSSSDRMCVIQFCLISSLGAWQVSAKSEPGVLSTSMNLNGSSASLSSSAILLICGRVERSNDRINWNFLIKFKPVYHKVSLRIYEVKTKLASSYILQVVHVHAS